MHGQNLKELVKSKGEERAYQVLKESLNDEKDPLKPADFSFRELYDAFVGLENLDTAYGRGGFIALKEAGIGSTVFPKITGELISKMFIEGYNYPNTIGDQLVTVLPSKLRSERIPGFTALDLPREIAENMPYPEVSSFTEKYIETDVGNKVGIIIRLTKELITLDQTGMILMRARDLGKRAALYKEKDILEGIQDVDSVVYRPSGTATALYSSGHGNVKTSNALVDWTDVDAARLVLAAITDEVDEKILIQPNVILVPEALSVTAWRIVHATTVAMHSGAYPTSGNLTSYEASNAPHFSGLKPLSSPILDTTSATTWYLGDFKEQFLYQEIWPLQVLQQDEKSDAGFDRDVVASFKCRHWGKVAARDKVYVCKSSA